MSFYETPTGIAEKAVRKVVARGYDAATPTRHRRDAAFFNSFPLDEDHLIGPYDREKIRLECRDLRRNSALVAGGCNRFADNIVGNGIMPQAKTTDEAWNTQAEEYFRQWAKVCDIRGVLNLREIQRMHIEARLTDGELGCVLLKNGQVQLIEAERIISPDRADKTIIEGVQHNVNGRPVRYFIAGRTDSGAVGDPKPVAAEYFNHAAKRFRPDQVRGVPDFAPVINSIRDHDELHEALLNKVKLDGMRAYAIHSEDDNMGPRNAGPRNVRQPQGSKRTEEKHEIGMIYNMRPNERIDSLASTTPNPAIVGYTDQVLRIIGSAINVPLEFLIMDFSKTSFSSSKTALMQAWQAFDQYGKWLVDNFLQRLWNWRIAKAIREGDLPPAPLNSRGQSTWYNVEWSFPARQLLDPYKEGKGKEIEIRMGADSLTSLARSRGRTAENILYEKAMDIANAQKIAEQVSKAIGVEINWEDLINLS